MASDKFLARSVVAAALIVGIPFAANAMTTTSDTVFAMKAAQAGMAEVKLGSLALEKSQNRQVISFAREMRMDHGKANTQLSTIMTMKGLTPPKTVGSKNATLMTSLEAKSGASFDAAYLRSQLPAHQEVLALFQAEAAHGADADLVAFAKQTIPVIKSHIAMDKRDIAMIGSPVGMQMPMAK